jgi:predicted O-methyltransferase YrrM
MNHSEVIYQICAGLAIKPNSYLELGLYEGETFKMLSKLIPNCIGVDFSPKNLDGYGGILVMSTDEFFNQNKETFDIIFIDADHKFESVKTDLLNAIKILNYNGMIFLHDTDPESEYLLQDGYCSNSYKILEYINNELPELTQITLPVTQAGLTIVKRKHDSRVKTYLNV